MIPRISATSPTQTHYLHFLEALKKQGFAGEITPDFAQRVALSTDNSIYQRLPQGVIFPQSLEDLVIIAELANHSEFQNIVLAARGGGTGTNGQSLTDGIVVDLSRHMNTILEINADERWVRVQTGVVKDQLNAALKPYGLFFAPELSTSNRATIGGMINTDASGQGSCLYGKTRDHVLELTTVLTGGDILHTATENAETLLANKERQDKTGIIHRVIDNIYNEHKDAITATFPKLNRCLTGYDLAHIRDEKEQLNLNNILCGSEGTLGFIAEAKLNVLPIPKYANLAIVYYDSFDAALRDAPVLMEANPTSIETIDSTILKLAMDDIVWHSVENFFDYPDKDAIRGINLVEYTDDNLDTLNERLNQLKTIIAGENEDFTSRALGFGIAEGDENVKKVWNMRKKAVGLLGNAKGHARPVPFVEDTAVPPENLADFIAEFRAILDSYNLTYGMFGHVDAGVLHVRPALDLRDENQEILIREITDKVANLTQQYGGLLWGEHGKGVRSEYAPAFFGELYPQLQRIKAVFDPHNQLNPGKIATPDNSIALLNIDEVTLRGQEDRKIPVNIWDANSDAVYCNGNGACFNWDHNDAMCPSWKVTRDRTQSPKGRATLFKTWLAQITAQGGDPSAELNKTETLRDKLSNTWKKFRNQRAKSAGEYDFSHEVYDAMASCLACKSCTGQCPIKIDVPEFRSRFLSLYYTRYMRPVRDYLISNLESLLPIMSWFSGFYNFVVSLKISQWFFERVFGFVDAPKFSPVSLTNSLLPWGVKTATPFSIEALSEEEHQKAVIIVPDAFTRYFDTKVVVDMAQLLVELGFVPFIAPFKPNGKPLHVHGFLKRFRDVAKTNSDALQALAASGIPMIGIDPAMTLTYRSEYRKVLTEEEAPPNVMLPQEFLVKQPKALALAKQRLAHKHFTLLPHCTEKTNAAASINDWKSIFNALGLSLSVGQTGCCGMSGTFGHEARNRENSAQLFQQSWQQYMPEDSEETLVLATGYSCRSQAKREANTELFHPFQAILMELQSTS